MTALQRVLGRSSSFFGWAPSVALAVSVANLRVSLKSSDLLSVNFVLKN